MELITYTDSRAFYQRAEPFLLAHEAEHNLPLGICSTILAEASKPVEECQYPYPFMGIIEEQGEVAVVALRTPPHHLILSLIPRSELADGALSLLLDHLSVAQPDLTGIVGTTALSKAFADHWQQRTGHTYHLRDHERIYRLETVQPVSGVAGAMRKATRNDRDLLASWYAAFMAEALPTETPAQTAEEWADRLFQTNQREAYLWEDQGQVVSWVGTSGNTLNGTRIGPVYTPPSLRGRGYASACTAAVSQLVLDRGKRFCFLFTDLANPTSNDIYQQIGYQPVIDVDNYFFE
jgi:predicted GNAT family acetyltransferase